MPYLPSEGERLYRAIELLATSNAPIQNRVYSAWIELMPLRAEDFSGELGAEFKRLSKEVTSEILADDEGTLHATVFKMTDDVAGEHARALLLLFCKVLGYFTGA